MEVIKCGTQVTPKLTNIKGIITGISIRYNRATYELSYFIEDKQQVIWLDEDEFDCEKKETIPIGFK